MIRVSLTDEGVFLAFIQNLEYAERQFVYKADDGTEIVFVVTEEEDDGQ